MRKFLFLVIIFIFLFSGIVYSCDDECLNSDCPYESDPPGCEINCLKVPDDCIEIKRYNATIYGRYQDNRKALIYCFGGENNRLIGYCEFYRDGEGPGESCIKNGLFYLYYDIEQLDAVLGLLRDDGPVYFYQDKRHGYCCILVTNEKTGE